MSQFERPEVDQIHQLLEQHSAMIVHFSSIPKTGGSEYDDLLFPEDLRRVIRGDAKNSGISCSTVIPTDTFHGTSERNAFGTIGVIIDLSNKDSLRSASNEDGGSYIDNGERVCDEEKNITILDLEKTITERSAHNEWVIQNYKVLGLFAIEPLEIFADYPGGERAEKKISSDELRKIFPDEVIYTFQNGSICKFGESQSNAINHREIYKP